MPGFRYDWAVDPRLLAVSDLHVRYPENRAVVERLRPGSDGDWLIVAGDVAEQVGDVAGVLELLAARFARVLWVPGNHELWTRGREPDGPVVVAPLFLLYDYSFLPEGATGPTDGLAIARAAGVVCSDEYVLHPDPYPDRAAWCAERVRVSRERLDACDPALPTVLVNHWPLTRHPTRVLRHPEFALWCGTVETADWHVRYRAVAAVYGHLHIPRVTWEDGTRFVEASLGYPREWRPREERDGRPVTDLLPRQVLPLP